MQDKTDLGQGSRGMNGPMCCSRRWDVIHFAALRAPAKAGAVVELTTSVNEALGFMASPEKTDTQNPIADRYGHTFVTPAT